MQRLFLFLFAGLVAVAVAGAPPRAVAGGGGTFVYLHDNDTPDNRVIGFRLESNGALTVIPGSPFSTGDDWSDCGGLCQTAAFSGRRDLLFASGANGVTVFQVDDDDGSLSVVTGSPFGGETTLGVAVVEAPLRTFVYASGPDNDHILGFQVQGDDTLAPVPGSPFPSGPDPDGLSTAKGFLFAALEEEGQIAAFKVQGNGSLVAVPGSPFDTPAEFIYNVHASPDGKFVYINDARHAENYAFKVKNNGALVPVVGSPFPDALGDSEGLALSSKQLLVSLDFSNGELQTFRRNNNGALTALGGIQDTGLDDLNGVGAFDPKGKFLVLADDDNNQVASFSVNKNTGVITPVDADPAALENINAVVFARP